MAILHDDTKDRAHTARPHEPIRSLIPARLDRLGWSRFHTMLVVALGVAWVLDGLEITIASNVTALISKPQALNLSSGDVSFAIGTVYLLGEVAGALFFGRMSDKWGRRNLFMISLGVYLFGGLLTETPPSTSSSRQNTGAKSTSPSTAPTGEGPFSGPS
jgi:hypothetical protein